MSGMLLKTQLAFDNCKRHLEGCNSWGTEIEWYLTQHVLVILCSEVQQEIYKVVENRVNVADDEALKEFTLAASKRVLRSVGKSEVAGFVGYFGSDAKEHLNQQIDDETVTIYNNAISNRHEVAHSSGSNMTFRELESAIDAAKKVISGVNGALSLNIEEV